MSLVKLANYFSKKRESHAGKGALIGGASLGTAAALISSVNASAINRHLGTNFNIPLTAGKYGARGLVTGALLGAGVGALIRTKKKDKK